MLSKQHIKLDDSTDAKALEEAEPTKKSREYRSRKRLTKERKEGQGRETMDEFSKFVTDRTKQDKPHQNEETMGRARKQKTFKHGLKNNLSGDRAEFVEWPQKTGSPERKDGHRKEARSDLRRNVEVTKPDSVDLVEDWGNAKMMYEGTNASFELGPSNKQNTSSSSTSGRANTPSRSKSIDDEEKRSLAAPARKPAKIPLWQTARESQGVSAVACVLPDGLEEYGMATVAAPPKAFAEYSETSTARLRHDKTGIYRGESNSCKVRPGAIQVESVGENVARPAYPSHDKSHILHAESNSREARPGAVQVRGVSYHSGLSSPFYDEEHNHESMPPVVDQGQSLAGNLANESVVSAYAVDEPSLVHEARIIDTKRQRILLILGFTTIIIVVVAIIVPVVLHFGNRDDNTSTMMFSAIINNLCSPRHMRVHDNVLYVPEAGVGPTEIAGDSETKALCLPTNVATIPDPICFGNTGRVNIYNLDGTSAGVAPLTGLFSARFSEGTTTNQVYGASAVDFDESGNMFTLLGLGLVNASDVAIHDPELVFASVLRDDQVVASPWVKLFEKNYAGVPIPETNPFHMHIHNGTTYIVDAGADLLYTYLNVDDAGTDEPDSVIVLPKVENILAVEPNPRGGPCNGEIPPPLGPSYCGQYQDSEGNWLYSANPVPTAVRVNPTEPNRLYVAYLSGSFWNEPVSGIFYFELVGGIPQNSTIKSIRGDFWAVIDFDFYEDSIFVLETNPGGFVPFGGRLSQVKLDSNSSIVSRVTITEDLYEPVGMLIHEDMIYVSNTTFNEGLDDCNGHILSAKLR